MNNIIDCNKCKFKNEDGNICDKHKVTLYPNLNSPDFRTNAYYPCATCNGDDFKAKNEEVSNMKFELGKYYQHSNGRKLHICGLVDTLFHGESFVGEDDCGKLSPVGKSEDHAVNFKEITRNQFIGAE